MMQRFALLLLLSLSAAATAQSTPKAIQTQPNYAASHNQHRELNWGSDVWYTLLNHLHVPCPGDNEQRGHCAHHSHHSSGGGSNSSNGGSNSSSGGSSGCSGDGCNAQAEACNGDGCSDDAESQGDDAESQGDDAESQGEDAESQGDDAESQGEDAESQGDDWTDDGHTTTSSHWWSSNSGNNDDATTASNQGGDDWTGDDHDDAWAGDDHPTDDANVADAWTGDDLTDNDAQNDDTWGGDEWYNGWTSSNLNSATSGNYSDGSTGSSGNHKTWAAAALVAGGVGVAVFVVSRKRKRAQDEVPENVYIEETGNAAMTLSPSSEEDIEMASNVQQRPTSSSSSRVSSIKSKLSRGGMSIRSKFSRSRSACNNNKAAAAPIAEEVEFDNDGYGLMGGGSDIGDQNGVVM